MIKAVLLSLVKLNEDRKMVDALTLEFKDFPTLYQIEKRLREQYGHVYTSDWQIVGIEALKEKEG